MSHRRGPSPLVMVLAVVAMAGVFLAVMPIRTYLNQRRSEVSISRQLVQVRQENRDLAQQIAQLNDPSQVENIARTRYGLVEPGQQSYVILPTTTTTVAVAAPTSSR